MTIFPRSISTNDDKRRVLEATDIVRLIGEQLALKAKGREFVGLCPFHNDHKPSMSVVPLGPVTITPPVPPSPLVSAITASAAAFRLSPLKRTRAQIS